MGALTPSPQLSEIPRRDRDAQCAQRKARLAAQLAVDVDLDAIRLRTVEGRHGTLVGCVPAQQGDASVVFERPGHDRAADDGRAAHAAVEVRAAGEGAAGADRCAGGQHGVRRGDVAGATALGADEGQVRRVEVDRLCDAVGLARRLDGEGLHTAYGRDAIDREGRRCRRREVHRDGERHAVRGDAVHGPCTAVDQQVALSGIDCVLGRRGRRGRRRGVVATTARGQQQRGRDGQQPCVA